MSTKSSATQSVTLRNRPRKSLWPARLDLLQSTTGLILVLFMFAHMFFVSSILLGKDIFWKVARMFEGFFIFGKSYPWLVSLVVAGVIIIFVLHALFAVRKFPINYREYHNFKKHMHIINHGDTTLWIWQVYTGFALFFLAMPHLYIMLTHPALIGPYESADRVWSDTFWPLYVVLLIAVELHAGIGLYRLFVKWGWFMAKTPDATRKRMMKVKWILTVFFLTLGFASLCAYIKIGIEHAPHYGEHYIPTEYQNLIESK